MSQCSNVVVKDAIVPDMIPERILSSKVCGEQRTACIKSHSFVDCGGWEIPAMIYTVTLNTSVDVTLEVPIFRRNSVLQVVSAELLPAGKGINAARVVQALGEPVTALGIVGRESRALFSTAAFRGLKTGFVYADGRTRQNVTILERDLGASTHIRTTGFCVDGRVIREIALRLRRSVRKGDLVLFCGSLPPGANGETYRDLALLCKRRGALVAIDTEGASLRKALEARPELVKLNRAEFISTFRRRANKGMQKLPPLMAEVMRKGIGLLAVSLGGEGLLVLRSGEPVALHGHLKLGPGFAHRKVVGSGDALFAGLAIGMTRQQELEETVKLAVACGAANVLTARALPPDAGLIRRLARNATVEAVPFR